MSRQIRILLVAVVALAAVGGYYKLVLAPKRAQIAALDQQVATAQAQLAQTQSLIVSYEGAKTGYEANYSTVMRLGKAIPADDDTRSLVVQLDAAAKRSGVVFDNLDVAATGASPTASASNTPIVPGAVNGGTYSAIPFALGFNGSFNTLSSFLGRLERFVTVDGDRIGVNGRLMRVESISLQPSDKGWPGMTATVSASAYIVPASQGLTTAGTSATTGVAATATGATAPGSTATPSTTTTPTTTTATASAR